MCSQSQLQQITQDVSRRVQAVLGSRLHSVILFGSYARGDYDDESDIDIMVLADVGEDVRNFARKLNIVSSDVSLEYGITICVMLNDKLLFDQRLPILPFYQNVMNDGVQLYGS